MKIIPAIFEEREIRRLYDEKLPSAPVCAIRAQKSPSGFAFLGELRG
jgi:hypothetical protein